MRIALLSNSQGTDAGVSAAETYPELVRARLASEHEVRVMAMSGWAIGDFNAHIDDVLADDPELVVLQVGIVECAQRILSEREKRILQRVPGSRRLTAFLHARRTRVIRARRALRIMTCLYTLERFRDEVDSFVAALGSRGVDVLLVRIPRFSDAYEAEFYPYINEDIELFNTALVERGAVPLVSEADTDVAIWQPGTVHLNAEGHRAAADTLLAALRSVVSEPVGA